MGKGRKQSDISKLLELSMNTQCVVLETKERQQLRKLIDEVDDKRRFEYREKTEDYILNLFESLENNNVYEAKKILIKYEKFLKDEFSKEDYYEKLDDENRENILSYLDLKTNDIRNNNSEIEKELMQK